MITCVYANSSWDQSYETYSMVISLSYSCSLWTFTFEPTRRTLSTRPCPLNSRRQRILSRTSRFPIIQRGVASSSQRGLKKRISKRSELSPWHGTRKEFIHARWSPSNRAIPSIRTGSLFVLGFIVRSSNASKCRSGRRLGRVTRYQLYRNESWNFVQ